MNCAARRYSGCAAREPVEQFERHLAENVAQVEVGVGYQLDVEPAHLHR